MEGAFERTLTVTGPVTPDVSANSGVIRVLRGEAGSVRIRGVVRARSSFFLWGDLSGRMRRIEANPPIAQDGNAIGVGDVTDRWLLRGINLLLEITTPADSEVRALADAGDIRIEGIDGPVECETDSGGDSCFRDRVGGEGEQRFRRHLRPGGERAGGSARRFRVYRGAGD